MRSIILSSLNKCHDQMADDPESTTDPEPEPRPEKSPSLSIRVTDLEPRPETISNPSNRIQESIQS
jgi:hypothetical protein